MPGCPKCTKDIDFLVLYERGWCRYNFGKNGGRTEKVFIESLFLPGQDVDEVYKCPKCECILFANGQDARKFLMLDEDGQEIMITVKNKCP